MSTLGIAICMGLYYWIARLRFGYTISSALLQPTTIAVFVGLITGQMALSMEIGAALQLVYLGVTSTPGGNVPNDPALAGTIAIPLGVMSGMTPELAVALAVPFGVIGVFVDQLRRTTNAFWVHMADKYAEEANIAGIMRCAYLFPALMGFVIRFPFVFVIDYFWRRLGPTRSSTRCLTCCFTPLRSWVAFFLPSASPSPSWLLARRSSSRSSSWATSPWRTSRFPSWAWQSLVSLSPSSCA